MTKTFRSLYYIPSCDGHPTDDAIAGYSLFWNTLGNWKNRKILKLLRCSHEEIWTPDGYGAYENGLCWTSTMRETKGCSGSCVRPSKDILKNPERWFWCEYAIPDDDYGRMILWMQLAILNNKGYDLCDIGKYFLPIRRQNPEDYKFICSGFCHIAKMEAAANRSLFAVRNYVVESLKVNDPKTFLPSPLLSAYIAHLCGVKFYRLDNGKEIN